MPIKTGRGLLSSFAAAGVALLLSASRQTGGPPKDRGVRDRSETTSARARDGISHDPVGAVANFAKKHSLRSPS